MKMASRNNKDFWAGMMLTEESPCVEQGVPAIETRNGPELRIRYLPA